jgi:hypothetical protein
MAGDEEDEESLFTLETRRTYSHLRELKDHNGFMHNE